MSGYVQKSVVAGGDDPGRKYKRPAQPRSMLAATTRMRHSPWVAALLLCQIAYAADHPVVIGSKKFTESYVLGEIARRTLLDAGLPTEHRQGMGGTIILWQALRGSQIDAYPEYTGTIAQEIVKRNDSITSEQIARELEKLHFGMTELLVF